MEHAIFLTIRSRSVETQHHASYFDAPTAGHVPQILKPLLGACFFSGGLASLRVHEKAEGGRPSRAFRGSESCKWSSRAHAKHQVESQTGRGLGVLASEALSQRSVGRWEQDKEYLATHLLDSLPPGSVLWRLLKAITAYLHIAGDEAISIFLTLATARMALNCRSQP